MLHVYQSYINTISSTRTHFRALIHSLAAGEWVTAYQAEQRSRLKTVFLSQQHVQGQGSSGYLSPPANTREASGLLRKTLDKRFLMRHCFVEQPTDLSDGDISGVHLRTVSI